MLLLVQLILWVVVISAMFDLRQLKSRISARRINPVVIKESTDVVLTFNKEESINPQ